MQQIDPNPRDLSPYRSQPLLTRRVRRTIRRIDPWSVLKLSVVFNLAVMAVFFLATVLLFYVAKGAGIVENLESLIRELGWDTFRIRPVQVFRAVLLLGVVNVIFWSGISVFMTFLYNLISDLVGGVEITMSEKEL